MAETGEPTKQLSRAQLFKTNDVVKTLIIKYGTYTNIFAENMSSAFAKATHIFFFSKNTGELDIVPTRIFSILPINELFKLTIHWTSWPWCTDNSITCTC